VWSACAVAQNPQPSFSTLYSFKGGTDGANPHSRLSIGSGGVLYGTTYSGGDPNGDGMVFSLTPPASPGGDWTESVLHAFNFVDGAYPNARVVIGAGGVLYGTTYSGGSSGFGTVFSLTPPASPDGLWNETVVHSFGTVGYGASPRGGLALGLNGVLYGTTQYGGATACGTVFALVPPVSQGGAWTQHLVYSFECDSSDGHYPYSSVVIGTGGVLYGTTWAGGASNLGTVYSLTPPASPGDPWTEAVLYSFAGGHDGANPDNDLAVGDGTIYGTTKSGGSSNGGTAFTLTPTEGNTWHETVIHEFPSKTGHFPNPGPLSVGPGGALYGTTEWGGAWFSGTVFKLQPPVSPGDPWTEILLHTFSGPDGLAPAGVVVGGSALYGTTASGGSSGAGTVFALTP